MNRCRKDEQETQMTLLVNPPELAEWWTVLQAVMWLDMDPTTLEQVVLAILEDTDDKTRLSEIWERLDFCSQLVLVQGMEDFDAEVMAQD